MQKIMLWVASLIVLGVVGSAFIAAQTRGVPEPRVLSGNDIGFRLEGTNPKGEPIGTLVVRINGQWVEPRDAPRVHQAR